MEANNILIIGGGAAGISVAASLQRHSSGKKLSITIVDPAERHYYQPAFTIVGGGVYSFDKTHRPMKSLIPNGVTLVSKAATKIDPDNNQVTLDDGETLDYDYLVVCPGLVLDWDAIEGAKEALGKNGVCSNYSPDYVRYTWETLQTLESGCKAIFTQAPMPFKCPGAPQKIAYLTADHLRRKGILEQSDVTFANPGPGMFGVPYFAKQLDKVIEGYGIHKKMLHKLVKVDGDNKKATFEVVDGDDKGKVVEMAFDMLHITPHQRTPDFLQGSPVCNAGGWVEVDQESMQHVKYPNVFSLGDACSTPNSKTAAAVRKQVPTVVANINHVIDGEEVDKSYYGYGSCPLTTSRGKVLMAEFIYGGKVTPTLPFFTTPYKSTWLMWISKTIGLPLLYWSYMLKGHHKFFEPSMDFDTKE